MSARRAHAAWSPWMAAAAEISLALASRCSGSLVLSAGVISCASSERSEEDVEGSEADLTGVVASSMATRRSASMSALQEPAAMCASVLASCFLPRRNRLRAPEDR